MPRFVSPLLAALLWLGSVALAHAEERIYSFNSDILIETDGTIRVTETIQVKAEGNQIRRGIYRTFPTDYKNAEGFTVRPTFDVLSVKRNGSPEPYKVEKIAGGKRIRIGDANVILNPGAYTYQIVYRTKHQLGHFDEFDELFWNVTGNEWDFPIDRAIVKVRLPGEIQPLQMAGYTGKKGATETNYKSTSETGKAEAWTTVPLGPHEGFTFAVSWPEGYVTRPTQAEKTERFFRDNIGAMTAWGGLLVVFIYFYRTWASHGRDPEAGTIVPRFKPPVNFSPAACRYVWKMSYDRKAFTAALINMAVKGFIKINDEGKDYRIEKVGKDPDVLSPGEQRIASRLIGTTSAITLKQDNHTTIGNAINAFSDTLESEYQTKYFVTNLGYFLIGLAISAFFLIAAILLARDTNPEAIFSGGFMGLWSLVIGYFGFKTYRTWKNAAIGFGSQIKNFLIFGAFAFVLLNSVGAQAFAISKLGINANVLIAIAICGILACNITFYFLLKAPTQLGRRILDEIEGFRLYLSKAEHYRLDKLHAPEQTPELFEKFLPYAMALDLETEWTESFDSVLKAASMEDGSDYHPVWYSGNRWSSSRPMAFASGLSSSMASAVSASATPPGSSSGSGGGGFSGGGGGGGGGGGW